MKGLIVNALAGVGLFGGALIGGLAATGRLSHEGVANIPVLNLFFPAPPADPIADPHADPHVAPTADPHAAKAGTAADAHGAAEHGAATDAAHTDTPQGQEPQGAPAGETKPLKRGRSLFEPEKKEGGGHGEEKGGHGEDKAHGKEPPAHGADPHAATPPADPGKHAAERDFDHLADELAQDRKNRYAPGGYFRFDGMPSGLTPDKLNEAWARVQTVVAELDQRKQALDVRDRELRDFADDIARRQTELGKERQEVEAMQIRLDERIEQFQQQVKLVRTDEMAGFTRNALTIANLEPSKAVELLSEQWKTEAGQDEVLKMLEFMDKDDIDEIFAVMPSAMVRDVLQKRLKVSKEPAPSQKQSK